MKKDNGFFNKHYALYLILLFCLILNTVIFAFIETLYMLISAIISLFACGIVAIRLINVQKYSKNLSAVFEKEARSGSRLLSDFSLPVIYTSDGGEILWYNKGFSAILKNADCYGANIYEFLKINKEEMLENKKADFSFGNREFTVFSSFSELTGGFGIFYLVDNTALKRTAKEFIESRPVMLMLSFDNFREVTSNIRESEIISLRSAIHNEIEKWLIDIPSVTINRSDSNTFVIIEEKSLSRLISGKFSVLESVRKLKVNNISGVTLSIGIGRGGKSFAECENFCKQALDMAQSRGGDQAAIKGADNDYKFFGGVSKAVERKTKVKARVVSSSIKEMFSSADTVFLMGHKFSDLDCLGAAFALSLLAGFLKKKAYIVFDKEKTLASSLYNKLNEEGFGDVFISEEEALSELSAKSLLVVLDTHRPSFVESPALYEKSNNVIVIDHHRKSVDAIDNAVIFYHETATSSTCEMVSEILQYVNGFKPSKLCAEALLSGIILDSKNLCLHTGVRTYEACAYLRANGADPIVVKKLFSDSIETYSRKAEIVSAVKLYNDCAISHDDIGDGITRIAAAQAADELLNLKGVNASFVMSKLGEDINISARSLGAINVQLIMESLGGGGHQNMAACQLKTNDFNVAYKALLEAINEYKKSL